VDLTPTELARFVSWVATGLGVGLWVWSWVRETNPVQKQRFMDCGVVLVFASTLVRVMVQEREMTPIDWALVFLSPLFIAAALWRLGRTACPTDDER
jgi:hypothetical protein